MNKRILNLALVPGVMALFLTSCSKQEVAPVMGPNVIAQVDGRDMTSVPFEEALRHRARSGSDALALKETVLEEMIDFESLYSQACRAGWQTNADLLVGFKRAVVARFKEQALAAGKSAAPTEAEVNAYYHEQAAQFTSPGHVRGAVILFETPAKATPDKHAEAQARAKEIRAEILKAASTEKHFGQLAQKYSVDQATRYAGGDFGALTEREIEGRYGAELVQALKLLKSPGETSSVVETPRGLALVKLIERTEPIRQPLAQVRNGIVYHLTKAKQANAERDLTAQARSGATIRINRPLLESIRPPHPEAEPPAMAASPSSQL